MCGKLFLGLALATGLLCLPAAEAFAAAACKVKPFAGGSLNSPLEESRISFSPDGNTAYFARSESFGPAAKSTMYESKRVDGKWAEATVAAFSGTFSDFDPFVSSDGKRLYFTSNRPLEGTEPKDNDIWYVEMTGEAWGTPVHVTAVNKPGEDLFPSITPVGSLVFGSDRTALGKDFNIFEAKVSGTSFGTPKALNDRINTKAWEFNPSVVTVSRDGGQKQQMLLFVALNRQGGRGLGDLWITPFATKLPLQPEPIKSAINSPADEYHPSLTPDGKTLVFVRRKAGKTANGDFMEANWPACAFGPILG
jgi:Tol biopolymer transport system component